MANIFYLKNVNFVLFNLKHRAMVIWMGLGRGKNEKDLDVCMDGMAFQDRFIVEYVCVCIFFIADR